MPDFSFFVHWQYKMTYTAAAKEHFEANDLALELYNGLDKNAVAAAAVWAALLYLQLFFTNASKPIRQMWSDQK